MPKQGRMKIPCGPAVLSLGEEVKDHEQRKQLFCGGAGLFAG